MVDTSADNIASLVLSIYSGLKFRPPGGQFTVLAGFVLVKGDEIKVISIGTGSKCLPAARLPRNGDALHDSHAEVLARRGAIRWFLEEIARSNGTLESTSPWIIRSLDGKYTLQENARLSMYISTLPCGDASTRYLASFQDAEMATLKDSAPPQEVSPNATSRGRNGYSHYGVMRTKPGRADSPPTLSMSCSDKIASWNVLGIQGALASRLLQPIYISRVIIGEVEPPMYGVVSEECTRALYSRLYAIGALPASYRLNEPSVEFTSARYAHSRTVLAPNAESGCNDSLCWIADSAKNREVLINGLRRGVPPKHRHNPKFRPLLSKLSVYNLFQEVVTKVGLEIEEEKTYHESKQYDPDYQEARAALKGPGGPFEGWVTSGPEWEDFNINGTRAS